MNLKQKIGLGTVQFGLDYGISNSNGKTSPAEVKKILKYASKQGIDTIDTASAYGNAEQVLGENDLNEFRIVSKFMPPEKEGSISSQLQKSLEKLKQKNLYGYLAHRPSDVLANPEQWDELQSLKKKGLIKKIGFSLNEPIELTRLLNAGLAPDLIQIPFNYFDRRFESEAMTMKSNGAEIHTRSAFLQGLFFKKPDSLDAHFAKAKPVIQLLQNSFKNLSGSLLRFVTERTFIDKVIIGVENSQQLSENLSSLEHADILPELKDIFSDSILIPSQWPKN